MQTDGLRDLTAYRHDGIQGRHRVLENHTDLVAPDGAHLLLGQAQIILTVKPDFAPHHLCRGIGQNPQNAPRDAGLAGSGLSYQSQSLPLVQRQAHAVDRMNYRIIGVVFHNEIPDV